LISGPIVFTVVGSARRRNPSSLMLTLAMVLFTDAANADLDVVRRNLR